MREDEPSAEGLYFEEFVSELAPILAGVPADHVVDRGSPDLGVDIVIEAPPARTVLVEVQTDTPATTARLRRIAERLRDAAYAVPSEARLVLAIPGVLDPERQEVLACMGVELWDGPALAEVAHRRGITPPPSVTLRGVLLLQKPPEMQLRRRLSRLKPGKEHWVGYQNFCVDLLEYLFTPPLEASLHENSTSNGVNRRDIILANYASDGFWQFVRNHYSADFIVVDAKNSAKLVGKRDILQIANYLSPKGAGLFGMVLCRYGFDRAATWTVREQWMLHNKLIVAINDDDIRQMVAFRATGEDPSSLIRQKVEDFRLGL